MDMNNQLNLFDYDSGRHARNAAIGQVEKNARNEWLETAKDAVYKTARDKPEFIVDEIWKKMPVEAEVTTHDKRAMGAVVNWAVKEKYITGTGRYMPSGRITSHSVPRQIWKSLICLTEARYDI